MMEVITIRSQIRTVAQRWRAQYGGYAWASDEGKQHVQRQLDAVDKETATPALIASIIGNDSWVKPIECDECGVESETVILIGEKPDYESRTAYLCPACITRAAAALAHPAQEGE